LIFPVNSTKPPVVAVAVAAVVVVVIVGVALFAGRR
jgi:hypothetical protein